MSRLKTGFARRWFIFSSAGLLVFLCLAIILAANLVLRRGRLPRTGLITGSSMEPILRGPRILRTCPHCSESQEFALDTCKSDQPFRCIGCNKIDLESSMDVHDADTIGKRIRSGAQVRYASVRTMRAIRAKTIAKGLVHTSGLKRGDVLVLQESHEATKEVKRLVGFSGEHISIKEGDLFVNNDRWCKSLEQALRQSILLDVWDRASLDQPAAHFQRSIGKWRIHGGEFQGVLADRGDETNARTIVRSLSFTLKASEVIDNRLAVNAHDSHAVVPVRDFGIAFQLSNIVDAWSIECVFNSPVRHAKMSLAFDGMSLQVNSNDQVVKREIVQKESQSFWIVVALVDGHLLSGTPSDEMLREKLPLHASPALFTDEVSQRAPIEITNVSGNLAIDQILVFRDIFYRGNLDSESQDWEPSEGLVVLGDNVSASSDSRDRWPEGLLPQAAKGVVIETENAIEVILRQR